VSSIDAGRTQQAMAAAYQAVTADLDRLTEPELARPSGCLGWTRADLLFHLLLDAQRALVTVATPAVGSADTDFVSYWTPFRPGAEGYDEHARFVRRGAAAYRSDLSIVARWTETAPAAVRAAAALPPAAVVATQGHVLAAGDFLATLAVEATVHHLDLVAGDQALAGPSGLGLAVTRETLDGLLGPPAVAGWGDREYALKATGRAPLTEPDRARLGARADRFPLRG
jgi:uncharacterized protein (TIGR03083 family)